MTRIGMRLEDTVLFVYGTLLRGLSRGHLLDGFPFLGPAMLQRGDLYDLGAYPGIRHGSGIVLGELYWINAERLKSLDAIEGCYPEDEHGSLFVRRETAVTIPANGETVKAVCYFYNHDFRSNRSIPCGDYRRFLLEKNETLPWVTAYGSNLDTDRLKSRVGGLNGWEKGFLPGYRLVFNKRQKNGSEVYANIEYRGEGEYCPAVAYRLTLKQAEKLDEKEVGYIRMSLPFNTADTEEVFFAQGYVALPDWLTENRSPEAWYVQHLQIGYNEHGLDAGYLDRVLTAAR